MINDCSILLFAKAPIPGKVKTRLASDVGDLVAAQFAQLQIEIMVKRFIASHVIETWIAGDINHPGFDVCFEFDIPKRVQKGKTLGDKMSYAMQRTLINEPAAIIIGSDCTGVDQQLIEAVEVALADHDMVFVPADDGGFVLWASKVNEPQLFAGVDWARNDVWAQTQSRLADFSLDYAVLDSTWDIDTLADLKRQRADLPDAMLAFLEEHQIAL